jgi:NAD(P)-dependent dehydrogenase (short-subunit alcohol dehydrogenase family)
MKLERVLITGTTSGVGRALLAHYVSLGARSFR